MKPAEALGSSGYWGPWLAWPPLRWGGIAENHRYRDTSSSSHIKQVGNQGLLGPTCPSRSNDSPKDRQMVSPLRAELGPLLYLAFGSLGPRASSGPRTGGLWDSWRIHTTAQVPDPPPSKFLKSCPWEDLPTWLSPPASQRAPQLGLLLATGGCSWPCAERAAGDPCEVSDMERPTDHGRRRVGGCTQMAREMNRQTGGYLWARPHGPHASRRVHSLHRSSHVGVPCTRK